MNLELINKLSFMKNVSRFIIALVLMFSFVACGKIGDEEIYIIPNNYEGSVFILFNQKDGLPEKFEHGSRVYEVPANGVLKTQFSPNKGWHKFNKYFYSNGGQRREVPYEIDKNIKDSFEIHVCCQSAGNAQISPESSHPVSVNYSLFVIGSKSKIDSIAEESQRINAASLLIKK